MSTVDEPLETASHSQSPATHGRDWGFFWCALIATSVPMLVLYFSRLWAMERYQYFPFVFVTVGVLLYQRFDRRFHPPRSWLGWVQVVLAALFIAASIALSSPWLSAIGFVLMMASFLGSCVDHAGRSLLILALPVLMLVRLPLGYDQLLVLRLQSMTTELSSVMLDLFAIPHSANANVIRLANRELFVAEACSGIQSVFTLAFLALMVVSYFPRRLWLTPLYLAISVALAVAANTIRVTVVAVAEAWHGIDLSTGFGHDVVGYIALLIALLFLLSFDQLIMMLLHPLDPEDDVPNPLVAVWNWLMQEPEPVEEADSVEGQPVPRVSMSSLPMRVGFAGLFLLMVLGSAAQATRLALYETVDVDTKSGDILFDVPPDLLSTGEYEDWSVGEHSSTRQNADPRLGKNADIWEVEIGEYDGQVVLSQPYQGWHELCICYEIRDWVLINREVVDSGEDGEGSDEAPEVPIVVARLKQNQGMFGYLFYTCLGSNGDLINPPPRPGRLASRFDDLIYRGDAYDRQDLMMLQLWLTTSAKLSPDEVNRIKSDFMAARAVFVEGIGAGRPADKLLENAQSAGVNVP